MATDFEEQIAFERRFPKPTDYQAQLCWLAKREGWVLRAREFEKHGR